MTGGHRVVTGTYGRGCARRRTPRVWALPALGAALGALLVPAIAPAQEAPETSVLAGPDEIIVTARRRAERLGDVPVSITVLSDGRLDRMGAETLDDIARVVPNLTIPPAGVLGSGQPSIRGIFSTVGAATVGLYIDDVPIQIRPLLFTGNPNPHIFDLDRIEVLRGPQGTLFGASSLGGTIRLITRQPDLATYSGKAAAELSATRGGGIGYQASITGGGPLVAERLGFRGGVYYRRNAGYVDRVDPVSERVVRADINDGTTLAVRAALRARIGEAMTVTPSVQYQRERSDDLPFFESTRGPQRQAFIVDQPGRDDFGLASLDVEADLGAAVLTSVTSVYGRDDRRLSDYSTVFGELVLGGAIPGLTPPGGTRNDTDSRQRNVTQEVRLASAAASAALNWVVGGYYQRSDIRLVQDVAEPGVAALVEQIFGVPVDTVFGTPLLPGGVTYRGREDIVETQLAAFGEAGWRFTPTLEAIAGLRVSRSVLDLEVVSEGPYAGPDAAANRVAERRDETPVTPRLGLNYHPDQNTLVYASASRGYRAGGANTPVPPGPCASDLATLGRTTAASSYGSDALWNYELGAKASFPAVGMRVAAAIFQIHWSDIQQQVALPNCGFSYVDNLGSARSRGFELEAEVTPIRGLDVSAAVGFVDARFRDDLLGGVQPDTGARAILVERGDRVPFTPCWTISASAEYRVQLAASTSAFARAEYQFLGAYQRTPSSPAASYNSAIVRGQSRSYAVLRAGVQDERRSISLFAENLFDDRSVIFSSSDLVPVSRSPLRQTTARPRTIGLTASAQY